MHKDVTLATRMAGASLVHLPVLKETLATFTEAQASGWGAEDFSGVSHVVERRLGRKISRP
jgi:3-hydroxyisobutyrate dehydrogenase-like beta-hydroxyacid dehydrogenase